MCCPGSGAALGAFSGPHRITFPAVADADALGVVAIAEMGQLDAAHGNGDQVLAFLAD